jgi:beta-N-acetylhexosaminidase
MSDEALCGRRLMVGFEGSEFHEALAAQIERLKIGGVILFSRNIPSLRVLKRFCRDARKFAESRNLSPFLIAVDQEGGRVSRIPPPFPQSPGNPAVTDAKTAFSRAVKTAEALRDSGINLNLAPVLDVAVDPETSVMRDRSFGSDPERTAAMGSAVIDAHQKRGVLSCAKHFPGIGRTVVDSHKDLPVMEAGLDDLLEVELPPFQTAIAAGVPLVMLSHIHYPNLDPDRPASLSPAIANTLLRDRLCFPGVTITDDIDMGALENHFPLETVIRQIFAAEIDIALICRPGEKIAAAHRIFMDLLNESPENRESMRRSVSRIQKLRPFETNPSLQE